MHREVCANGMCAPVFVYVHILYMAHVFIIIIWMNFVSKYAAIYKNPNRLCKYFFKKKHIRTDLDEHGNWNWNWNCIERKFTEFLFLFSWPIPFWVVCHFFLWILHQSSKFLLLIMHVFLATQTTSSADALWNWAFYSLKTIVKIESMWMWIHKFIIIATNLLLVCLPNSSSFQNVIMIDGQTI